MSEYKVKAIDHGKGYDYFNNGKEDIRTHPSSKAYREGYDRIFGGRKKDLPNEKNQKKQR